MKAEKIIEALFQAYMEGEILQDIDRDTKLKNSTAQFIADMDAGKAGPDDIAILKYQATENGFYAGIRAARALFCGDI